MKPNIRGIIKYLTTRTKLITRKEALHFSIFLLLSIIFWFINALGKNYITSIDYPIRFSGIPKEMILTERTSDHVTFRVSAHGFVLLRHKLSSKYIPLNFSLNNLNINNISEKDSLFYIPTRYVREQFSSQLSSGMEIQEIIPDTLFFRLAKLVSKKLPVKLNINVEPDNQMILKGMPIAEPDSVIVTGPDYAVDLLKDIESEFKDFGVLSQTTVKQVELQKTEEVKLENSRIKVKVEVERFTEKTLSIPIEIIHLPDTIKLITFPASIELTCQVGLSNFPKIQPEMFSAIIDYNEISENTDHLTVNLVKQPEFVHLVKLSPKKVEYLISK